MKKYLPLLALLLVLAAAVTFFLLPDGFFGQKPDPDAVVASFAGKNLTNRELNYYYWTDYDYYLRNYNSSGNAFDPTKLLSEQQYNDTMTWQDYFIDSAMQNWRDITAVCDLARAEGFELPEVYQEAIDTLELDLMMAAEELGDADIGTAEDYLRYSYGEASTLESFRTFMENNYLASVYSDEVYFDLVDQHSAEPVLERTINVRHILLKNDEHENAKAEAERVYQLWLDGEQTEESFLDLAAEHSGDGGSNTNGGLYPNVAEGDMLPTFNDWCFDESRKPGDTGLVETTHGWHIMYFVGEGEPIAQTDDSKALTLYTEWLDEVTAGKMDIYADKVQIYVLPEAE